MGKEEELMNRTDEARILNLYAEGKIDEAFFSYQIIAKQPGYLELFNDNFQLTEYGLEKALAYISFNPNINIVLKESFLNNLQVNTTNPSVIDCFKTFRLSEGNYLNQNGIYKAIELLSLDVQCNYLDIKKVLLEIPQTTNTVEGDVIQFYSNHGWKGFHDEGNIFPFILRAYCIDDLRFYFPEFCENFQKNIIKIELKRYTDEIKFLEDYIQGKEVKILPNCHSKIFAKKIIGIDNYSAQDQLKFHKTYIETLSKQLNKIPKTLKIFSKKSIYDLDIKFLLVEDELGRIKNEKKMRIIESIRNTNTEEAIINLTDICNHHFAICKKNNQPHDNISGATLPELIEFLKSFNRDIMIKIVDLYFNGFFHFGWPDITLYRKDELVFIEVKILDCLSFSQIKTLNMLNKACRVGVLKVDSKNRINLRKPWTAPVYSKAEDFPDEKIEFKLNRDKALWDVVRQVEEQLKEKS
jgi:hypothetical protein